MMGPASPHSPPISRSLSDEVRGPNCPLTGDTTGLDVVIITHNTAQDIFALGQSNMALIMSDLSIG